MTGFSRHVTGKFLVQSLWVSFSEEEKEIRCACTTKARHDAPCGTNIMDGHQEGLDMKFTRHETEKTRYLRLC